ncbi:MAG: hypothetical protein HYU86_08905 [Chloroflexi bacterium]|nr:hypothetical protein [Chloroflexota bacterium]
MTIATFFTREELQAHLEEALAALEDLEEERRRFLGQTGVHIGVRIIQKMRRQFEREEAELRERIHFLKASLESPKERREGELK